MDANGNAPACSPYGDRAGRVVADDLAPNEERSVAGLDSEGVVVVLPEDVREDEDAPRRRCQLSGLGRCLVEAPERCLYFAVQALRAAATAAPEPAEIAARMARTRTYRA
jgi:hypothetical protein